MLCFQLWKTSSVCLLSATAAATPSRHSIFTASAVIQAMMKLQSDWPHPEAAEMGDVGGVWLSKQGLRR